MQFMFKPRSNVRIYCIFGQSSVHIYVCVGALVNVHVCMCVHFYVFVLVLNLFGDILHVYSRMSAQHFSPLFLILALSLAPM